MLSGHTRDDSVVALAVQRREPLVRLSEYGQPVSAARRAQGMPTNGDDNHAKYHSLKGACWRPLEPTLGRF